MSKLSCCVVTLFLLTIFAEDEVFAGDLGIIEAEDLGQLIVIEQLDQGGGNNSRSAQTSRTQATYCGRAYRTDACSWDS